MIADSVKTLMMNTAGIFLIGGALILQTATNIEATATPVKPTVTPAMDIQPMHFDNFLSFHNNNYNVSWMFNSSMDTLHFMIQVRAIGWIGFGFAIRAPNGMVGYDVAVGGVSAGMGYLQDYLTVGTQRRPLVDSQQDWTLSYSREENGVTTLRFHRKRDTGDAANDTVIQQGMPLFVIWAYHSSNDAQSGSFVQHTVRGWQSQIFTLSPTPVRLVGDEKHFSYGQVEVFLNGTWGTLCSSLWHLNNAHVICRQLGFDGAVSSLTHGPAHTSALHWSNDFNCTGNENTLSECQHGSWARVSFCRYHYGSSHGAMCKLQVRIVGGGREGLVQVYYNNNWGYVCGEMWEKPDADVVCRWMGYNFSTRVFKTTFEVSVDILMSNVHCTGSEDSLFSCVHAKLGNTSCANNQLAGVKCGGSEVRLGDNERAINQGLVEVLFNGVWGTICRSYSTWNLLAAHVVCRQLGYPKALQSAYNSEFVRASGKIVLTGLRCMGNETAISQCRARGMSWGVAAGCHSDDVVEEAGLICSPTVRLVEGPSNREGLVQVYYNNSWGGVCNEQWGRQDADVVCRELGYTESSAVYNSSATLQGNLSFWISNIECIGNEGTLMSCAHGVWTNVSCGVGQNAGVVCSGPTVRLVSTNSSLTRVDVLFGGFWGPICSFLDKQPANIVCRQFGYDKAYAVVDVDYGQGSMEVCLETFFMECAGNETSILQCKHSGWTSTFGESSVSSVICSPKVRLITGPRHREGIVQVYRDYSWGWVCAEQWDKQDADVVCRELGYQASSEVRHDIVGEAQHPVILMNNVQCSGTESFLSSCLHNGGRNRSCAQGEIAGVVCSGPEVRLINARHNSSAHRGIVEVLFGGVWGRVCRGVGYSWGIKEAHVTCRQLGFQGAQNAYDSHAFAATEGIAWMIGVTCAGNESALSNCNYTIPQGNSCYSFTYPVSVICNPLPLRLGKPAFLFSDSVSIQITWPASRYTNYTVQMWNNKSQLWENTHCKESTVDGSCVVAETKVLMENLIPSTTYYFRIYVSNMVTSAPSMPMKTKKLEPPSKPSIAGKTVESITIQWDALSLQSVMYGVQVQMNTQSAWKDAVCGEQSQVPKQCIVKGSVARITGLKHDTAYRFRVFAMFKGIRSEFSVRSDPLRTKGDVEVFDYKLVCRILFSLIVKAFYLRPGTQKF